VLCASWRGGAFLLTTTIAVPLWLLLIAGALALFGLIDRVLSPSLRWFLQRRANRAIQELNTRLKLKIHPFKMTERRVLIDRLTHDPEVIAAAEAHAKAENMPIAVAGDMVRRYATEIVPAFSAYTYFKVGAKLARWLSTALYRVRLGYLNVAALEKIDPNATVIFVMNHRSNMDYVLVTYMASSQTALSYAVGEWARIPVLQTLIRSMGAYFIRRNARNALYRKVLARYVQMSTEAGVTQAIFPEGGLSRDGKMRPVKLGLISYILEGWKTGGRDVLFVPVGLNYDRVLEDRTLIAEIDGPPPKANMAKKIIEAFGFIGKNIWLRLTGRYYRFGYASVSFGTPRSLRAFLEGQRVGNFQDMPEGRQSEIIAALGAELMQDVGKVIPALPVSLVSTVLIEAGQAGVDELSLKARVDAKIDALEAKGAHVHIPRRDRDYAVTAGLRSLVSRRIVSEDLAGVFRIAKGEDRLVAYYANAIAHHFEGAARAEAAIAS
jgi:glycerol-3-phosphate O-acyltransferase